MGFEDNYTIVLIEPRKHRAISYVIKNMFDNLDEKWNMQIFHGLQNEEYVKNIINREYPHLKNRIRFENLNIDNLPEIEYNLLMATSKFYERIATEIFLVIQTDCLINPNNKNNIENFLQYDYVGAPWKENGRVGNGGFSLRRRSKMLEIVRSANMSPTLHEDYFFSVMCEKMGYWVPSFEQAQYFSSETILNKHSFGIHKVWAFHSVEDIEKIIPDIRYFISLQYIET